jgi:hypothetical protein
VADYHTLAERFLAASGEARREIGELIELSRLEPDMVFPSINPGAIPLGPSRKTRPKAEFLGPARAQRERK